MKKTIREALTKADDKQRLNYLLAKGDTDDIQAALLLISTRLKIEIKNINISLFAGKIQIGCQSEKYYTTIIINLIEEQLLMWYNERGLLELFNQESECDFELIGEVKAVIESLGFYKTGEFEIQQGRSQWHNETYKIDVIRRKL